MAEADCRGDLGRTPGENQDQPEGIRQGRRRPGRIRQGLRTNGRGVGSATLLDRGQGRLTRRGFESNISFQRSVAGTTYKHSRRRVVLRVLRFPATEARRRGFFVVSRMTLSSYKRSPFAGVGGFTVAQWDNLCRRGMRSGRRTIPQKVKEFVRNKFKLTCQHCRRRGGTLDHIKPLALGGGNESSNFQTLCDFCNSRKGGRFDG